ncbi:MULTISPECIES: exopolysaccharide biosynthesis protein [Microbulbifer]|uniref:Exopolysaccharide biosynthesis protein n=1 Tax=Microbulbifer celer TaxID=435905 RepID=A0ABW3UAF1_9GAMM|nr:MULTISPECIES: exopolysaccharide biosynthesis protein [Microbulbifer]UFN59027.1 exopolysaccharide biosynthesis protein [Microbulbifer celer]
MSDEIQSLTALLQKLKSLTGESERVSLQKVLEVTGRRSFAPILLLIGLILFSPLSGIPGIPTLMSILVLLVAVQLLLGRHHFWLPQWLLQRSMQTEKVRKAIKALQKPAARIDNTVRPRLQFLVGRTGTYLIATMCGAIALGLPLMEVIPFSATLAGLALTIYGLALIAHDGLLIVLALIVTGLVPALLISSLL